MPVYKELVRDCLISVTCVQRTAVRVFKEMTEPILQKPERTWSVWLNKGQKGISSEISVFLF